jgi:hypothetical protein
LLIANASRSSGAEPVNRSLESESRDLTSVPIL